MNWLDRKLYWRPWWRKLRGLPEPRSYTVPELQDILNKSLARMTDQMMMNINKDYE